MTTDEFNAFIDEHALFDADGLIEITLMDDSTYEGIWITTIGSLGESIDGKFEGLPDCELFYVFDMDSFATWTVDQIKSLACKQKEYLQVNPVIKDFSSRLNKLSNEDKKPGFFKRVFKSK